MPEADPTRIIVRTLAAFVLRGATVLRRATGDPVSSAFLFAAVRRANVKHAPYGSGEALLLLSDASERGDRLRRGVSVNALSRTFDMPYETVRTCVNRFITRELMERREDGIIVPGRVLALPVFRETDEAIATALIDALMALTRLGVELRAIAGPTRAVPSGTPRELIARIAMDAGLGASEAMAPVFGGLTSSLVYCGALVMSAGRLAASPAEAWRYAAEDASPPVGARDPVSLRALSAALELPFETTRRHANDLLERRLLLTVPGRGVIPHPEAVSPGGGLARIQPALMGQAAAMLASLSKVGFEVGALGKALEPA